MTAPPAAANASGIHVALRRGKTGAEFCCVHTVLAHRELGPSRTLLPTGPERKDAVARRESAWKAGRMIPRVFELVAERF